MSKTSKDISPKSKAHNAHQLRMVNEIRDRYVCAVPWPLLIFQPTDIYRTSVFTVFGIQWNLGVSMSIFDGEQYLSVQLANQIEEDIYARYTLTLKNHANKADNISWSDPEGAITFLKKSTGNNQWGNEEFITVHDLESIEGYVVDQYIHIEIDMRVYGREDINANKALVDAIELANGEHDLIKLANEDLVEAVSKLPTTRNWKAQTMQEDHIIVARTNRSKR